MVRRKLLMTMLTGLLIATTGCRHLCRRCGGLGRNDPSPAPRGDLLIPPPTGGLPSGGSFPTDPALPPPTVGTEPSGSRFRPQKETLYPDPLLESPSIPMNPAGEPPPLLTIPDSSVSRSNAKSGSGTSSTGAASKSPVGLPGFATVRDRVATGRKPSIDGIQTLRATGYKTLVYLHDPTTDIGATRELAEQKGFTFLAIPTEPKNLNSAYATLVEAVGDPAKRPIFVFDDTGVRTGSLWYVYLRKIESLPDDSALVQASAFGLREAPQAEKTNFQLAAQELLAKR